jgi:hypothetical protein
MCQAINDGHGPAEMTGIRPRKQHSDLSDDKESDAEQSIGNGTRKPL